MHLGPAQQVLSCAVALALAVGAAACRSRDVGEGGLAGSRGDTDANTAPGTDATETGGPGDASARGGANATQVGQDAALAILLEPEAVCPGQCAQVQVVDHATSTSVYAFTPDLGGSADGGPGPYALCPESTTEIELSATDTVYGEFGLHTRVATATLEVRDDCVDGGAPAADGGSGDPGASRAPACFARFESVGWVRALDIAGDDFPVVVGWYRGEVTLGDLRLPGDTDRSRGFVVRFDDACRPLWARVLDGAGTMPTTVAVLPSGDVWIGGHFEDWAQVGGGPLSAVRDLFLLHLTAAGSFVGRHQIPTGESGVAQQSLLSASAAADGTLVLTGRGNATTDFGAGPVRPLSFETGLHYVVRLDGATPLYTREVGLWGHAVIAGGDGTVVVAGGIQGPVTWERGEQGAAGTYYDLVATLEADGRPGWSLLLENDDNAVATTREQQSLGRGADGTLYRARAEVLAPLIYGFAVTAITPDGEVAWHGAPQIQYTAPAGTPLVTEHALAVDGQDRVWVASHYDGSLPIAGEMLDSRGARDLVAIRLDESGQAEWTGTAGTELDDVYVQLHATPSGAAVMVATARTVPPTNDALIIARFAP